MTVICRNCGYIDDTMSILPVPRVVVGKIRGTISTDGRMTCRKCRSENLSEYREKSE